MKTDSAWKNIADKEHTLVLCDNYGQAGAINYYSKQKIQAVSLNADYINWFQLDKKILHVIRVKDNANDLNHERILFDTIDLTGVVENKFAREKGTAIFILSGPKTDINLLLAEEINKRKQY